MKHSDDVNKVGAKRHWYCYLARPRAGDRANSSGSTAGFDRREGPQLQGALTGRFQPLIRVGLGQAQDAKTRAVAHFRMRLRFENAVYDAVRSPGPPTRTSELGAEASIPDAPGDSSGDARDWWCGGQRHCYADEKPHARRDERSRRGGCKACFQSPSG
jgi:hypothetical protein